jgi:hypothetical protein
MKKHPNLDRMEEIRSEYRAEATAAGFEDVQEECDGLRGDLIDAGEIMLRAVEGDPDAVDDMRTFLTRSRQERTAP